MMGYRITTSASTTIFRFSVDSDTIDAAARFSRHQSLSGLIAPKLVSSTPLTYELPSVPGMERLCDYAAHLKSSEGQLLSIMSVIISFILQMKEKGMETDTLVLDTRCIFLSEFKRMNFVYLPVSRSEPVENQLRPLLGQLKKCMGIEITRLDYPLATGGNTLRQLLTLAGGGADADENKPEGKHANRSLFENMEEIQPLNLGDDTRGTISGPPEKIVFVPPDWIKPASVGIGAVAALMSCIAAGPIGLLSGMLGILAYYEIRAYLKREYIAEHGDIRKLKSKEVRLGLRVCYENGRRGNLIPIDASPFTIGRAGDNHLVIEDRCVSGHHAQIVRIDGEYRLTDLNSSNCTYLNGKQLSPGDRFKLSVGDQITFAAQAYVVDELDIQKEKKVYG